MLKSKDFKRFTKNIVAICFFVFAFFATSMFFSTNHKNAVQLNYNNDSTFHSSAVNNAGRVLNEGSDFEFMESKISYSTESGSAVFISFNIFLDFIDDNLLIAYENGDITVTYSFDNDGSYQSSEWFNQNADSWFTSNIMTKPSSIFYKIDYSGTVTSGSTSITWEDVYSGGGGEDPGQTFPLIEGEDYTFVYKYTYDNNPHFVEINFISEKAQTATALYRLNEDKETAYQTAEELSSSWVTEVNTGSTTTVYYQISYSGEVLEGSVELLVTDEFIFDLYSGTDYTLTSNFENDGVSHFAQIIQFADTVKNAAVLYKLNSSDSYQTADYLSASWPSDMIFTVYYKIFHSGTFYESQVDVMNGVASGVSVSPINIVLGSSLSCVPISGIIMDGDTEVENVTWSWANGSIIPTMEDNGTTYFIITYEYNNGSKVEGSYPVQIQINNSVLAMFSNYVREADWEINWIDEFSSLKYYDGLEHTLNITSESGGTVAYYSENEQGYTIEQNPTYKDVGVYSVIFKFTDGDGVAWYGEGSFEILKNTNLKLFDSSISDPSNQGLQYVSPDQKTISLEVDEGTKLSGDLITEAVYYLAGTTKISYLELAGSWGFSTHEGQDASVGTHTAYFTPTDTSNFAVISVEVNISFKSSSSLEDYVTVQGFEGEYDGQAHSITVDVNGIDALVYYSTENLAIDSEEWVTYYNNYTDVTPTPITIYIKVTADGFEPYKTSAKINITKIKVKFNGTLSVSSTLLINDPLSTITLNVKGEKDLCYGENNKLTTSWRFEDSSQSFAEEGIKTVAVLYSYLETIDENNFDFSQVPTTVSVEVLSAPLITENVETDYDATNHSLTLKTSDYNVSFVEVDQANISNLESLSYTLSTSPAYKNVGTYYICYKAVSKSNEERIFYGQVSIVINKITLTVTANDITVSSNKPLPEFGVKYEGFVNGESVSVLSGTLEYSTDYNYDGAEGEYLIRPSGLSATNYDINYVAGTLRLTEAKYAVSGSVVDETGLSVYGATVQLKQGATVKNTTTTNETGQFSFDEVLSGRYDVVISKSEKCSTMVGLTVENKDVIMDSVVLSSKDIAMKFEIDSSTNITISSGFDVLCADNAVIDSEKKAILDAGGSAEISLNISISNSNSDDAKTISSFAVQEKNKLGQFFEINIALTVTELAGLPSQFNVTETTNVLSFIIRLDSSVVGKKNLVLYRLHNGEVQTITTTAKNGERFELSADGTYATVYSKNFSLYAFGFEDEGTDAVGLSQTTKIIIWAVLGGLLLGMLLTTLIVNAVVKKKSGYGGRGYKSKKFSTTTFNNNNASGNKINPSDINMSGAGMGQPNMQMPPNAGMPNPAMNGQMPNGMPPNNFGGNSPMAGQMMGAMTPQQMANNMVQPNGGMPFNAQMPNSAMPNMNPNMGAPNGGMPNQNANNNGQ